MRTRNYKDGAVDLSLSLGTEIKKENNGRKKCRWENCSTILNGYNPNNYCHAHSIKGSWKDTLERDAELKAIAKRNHTSWADRKDRLKRNKLLKESRASV